MRSTQVGMLFTLTPDSKAQQDVHLPYVICTVLCTLQMLEAQPHRDSHRPKLCTDARARHAF